MAIPYSHYNVIKSTPDSRDLLFAKIASPVENLPSAVNMISKCPPVYNQFSCGSCTGNAIAAAYQFDLMRQGLQSFEPSRLFIYYNERVVEGTVYRDSGAMIRDGMMSISQNGVCPEELWPYDISKFAIRPSPEAYAAAMQHTTSSYYSVNVELESMKQTLAQGYPIVVGISVFTSFESSAVAKDGIVPMPAPNEACLGGHCILIVGYSDATQRFIVRNSWGADWGDKGYFYLPYDFATHDLMSDAWVLTTVR